MSDGTAAASALVETYLTKYPHEVARKLEAFPPKDIARFFEEAPSDSGAAVFQSLTPDLAAQVAESLSDNALAELAPRLSPTGLAALLSRLQAPVRDRWLRHLDASTAKDVSALMSYPPGSAGSLMDPRVLGFRPETTVREALARLRAARRRRVHELLVVDETGRLRGWVLLADIAVAEPTVRLEELMTTPPAVLAMAPEEEVVSVLTERRVTTLPVIDLEGVLLGAIRHDALVRASREEASADIQTMVGASREERALSKVSFAVRKRLPWLEINLGTAFLAAAVVGIFEDTIAQFTALAVLLPVVAGQSGNTGAQALAVTMRGLALREIRSRQWLRVLIKEVNVSLLNGIAVALTTSFFVYLWSGSLGLPVVIGTSMIISMAIAGLAGGGIPLLLTAFGQDPAQSSSIILTTVTDVVGFFSFLGIATLMSGML